MGKDITSKIVFDLYPPPSDSSPARVEESRREGMYIFIVRGAGDKPGWQITLKIVFLIFTPHLLIPLPQGARKVGERERVF
jgi:hypothetical protein